MLVWYGAATKHCSFFPGAHAVAVCRAELKCYSPSKGTVRFTPERPVPAVPIRKLVRARLATMG